MLLSLRRSRRAYQSRQSHRCRGVKTCMTDWLSRRKGGLSNRTSSHKLLWSAPWLQPRCCKSFVSPGAKWTAHWWLEQARFTSISESLKRLLNSATTHTNNFLRMIRVLPGQRVRPSAPPTPRLSPHYREPQEYRTHHKPHRTSRLSCRQPQQTCFSWFRSYLSAMPFHIPDESSFNQ